MQSSKHLVSSLWEKSPSASAPRDCRELVPKCPFPSQELDARSRSLYSLSYPSSYEI